MSQLSRVYQKLFGSTAAAGQIGKFGSLAAGSAVTTTDPTVIQALSNFLGGWYSAIVGSNSPALQDMNALFYLIFYQLCYQFQSGIPEYDATTTYYIGSIVRSGGVTYVSLLDDNTGRALSSNSYWRQLNGKVSSVSGAPATLTIADDVLVADVTGGNFVANLPAATTVQGKKFYIKCMNGTVNHVTVTPFAGDNIDGASTLVLNNNDTVQLISDGTLTWYII